MGTIILLYEQIEGFEFEWGFEYKLLIEKRKRERLAQDQSIYHLKLLEVLDKSEVPSETLFDVSVSNSGNSLEKVNDALYRVHGNKVFTCDDSDCMKLDSLIQEDMGTLLEFKYGKDKRKPFKLTRVKCSSCKQSYRESCNLSAIN